ncbi:MAG TPA: ABC transporter permease [Candidatus Limnocylindria bacterium]|nr:ABC transporter permease [Candidatus Limnocylindria bacterium]
MALPVAPLGADPAQPMLRGDAVERDAEVAAPSRAWAHLRRSPAFWFGAIVATAIVLLAIGADVVARYDPNIAIRGSGLSADGRPVGPSEEFWLGTDRLGRDYASRLLHGARTSLIVALGANAVAALIGTLVGATAAYAGSPRVTLRVGRWRRIVALPVEALLMRATDALLSLPVLLLAIALAAILGPSLVLLTIVIAAVWWTTTARIVFSQVRVILAQDFIEAARAIGARPLRILVVHVLPHIVPLVVVYATLGIAAVVLFESTLSFLGAGPPPPAASWGTMIAEHASYYRSDPRLLLLPGAAIALTVLAFNLLGDALRDALDPRVASQG